MAHIVPDAHQSELFYEIPILIDNHEIPHKYFYWDFHCSQLWKILVDSQNFSTHNQSARMIKRYYPDIHNIIIDQIKSPYDVFSLGVGTGEDDITILRNLGSYLKGLSSPAKSVFFPTDISMHLIEYSLGEIYQNILTIDKFNIYKYIDIAILNIDFLNIDKYQTELYPLKRYPRLYCLLGSTLGNYGEYSLLRKIFSLMDEEDYLLLGVDCPIGKCKEDDTRNRYSEVIEGYEFLMGPLDSVGRRPSIEIQELMKKSKPEYVDSNPIEEGKRSNLQIPNSKSIYHEIILNDVGKVRLNMSSKYDLASLQKWLKDNFGFDRSWITWVPDGFEIPGSYYCLLLLNKKFPLSEGAKQQIEDDFVKENTKIEILGLIDSILARGKKNLLNSVEAYNQLYIAIFTLKTLVQASSKSFTQLAGMKADLEDVIPLSDNIKIIITKYFPEKQNTDN